MIFYPKRWKITSIQQNDKETKLFLEINEIDKSLSRIIKLGMVVHVPGFPAIQEEEARVSSVQGQHGQR
jgi:hypothetical protein